VNDRIEELEAKLISTTDIERKIDLMNTLAWQLRHSDLSRATALCESAVELADHESYQEGSADGYYQLGSLEIHLGNYNLALSHLSRALALYKTLGDSRKSASVLNQIGNTWAHLGNYSDALIYFSRLGEIYQDMGLKKEQADALYNSCNTYCRLGRYEKALDCGLVSIQLYQEIGAKEGVAKASNSVGEAQQALGNHAQALTTYQKSLQISQEIGLRHEAGWALQRISDVYLDRDQPDKALACIHQALKIAQEINSRQRLLESHQLLAKIYKEIGDFEKALAHLEQFHTLQEKVLSEEADERVKKIKTLHQVETARKEAEIYRLKNVLLEQEISERKQVEEALQVTNAQLEEEITEREQLIADLDTFARTVAHDLKTPVSIITGHSALLLDDRVDIASTQSAEFIRLIEQTGYRMGRIIDEILFLASVRQREIIPHPLEMVNIIREAVKRLAPMIAEYGAEVIEPESWPEAWGYASWVEQVWVNTIGNAIKYGGEPPRVELGATAQANGTVRFWVRDNGAGLSQEAQAKLFTAFTRLDETVAQGHGLGLSIVKRIVEKLGGEVGVESEGRPGQGSTFSFTLPAVKAG